MAEFDGSSNSPTRSETTNLDDTVDSGNRSIIGKVKSRVSSILPTTFTKWFSPTVMSGNETPQNGSMVNAESALGARRRRRIELDDDEDDDEDGDGEGVVNDEEAALADNIAEHDLDGEEQTRGEYDNNLMRSVSVSRRNVNLEPDNEDDDDEVIEEILNLPTSNYRSRQNPPESNYNVYLSKSSRQPPSKRKRISDDQFSVRDSPIMPHRRPLVASTPAVGTYLRSSATNLPTAGTSATRTHTSRAAYMNLYRNQTKREPAYNFSAAIAEPALATSGDLPAVVDANIGRNKVGISSRRVLNIPHVNRHNFLPNLRRQSLNASTSTTVGTTPLRTSTAIHSTIDERSVVSRETESLDINDYENGPTTNINNNNNNNINDKLDTDASQKLVNGVVGGISSDVVPNDTASEASNEDNQNNMSSTLRLNKDNDSGSRTSSVDNMLNFYSHLHGRKSLFTGPQQLNQQQQHRQTGLDSRSGLYNSTLSLNSLNRRQFNPSIYASSSALSDSRLLNTFSPFYKGRTTYGGASAYNKYNTTLSAAGITGSTGAGARFIPMTPTVIRPTSSLSTRSSSTNSVRGNGEVTGMSDTAKRILELINEFSSPLADARKMGRTLSEYNQLEKLKRLNETDLETSRSIRNPRSTPYARPKNTVKSSSYMHYNGMDYMNNLTAKPPVRELTVPKMAQLMKMRDFNDTTERLRSIAMAKPNTEDESSASKYSKTQVNVSDEQQQQIQQQGKHINKMRQNKISSNARITSCKDNALEEEPLPQVPLPNLTFPMMQSVPQFDIQLPKHVPTIMSTKGNISEASRTMTKIPIPTPTTITPPIKNFAFNDKLSKMNNNSEQTFGMLNNKFKFSSPLIYTTQSKNLPTIEDAFKFSAPITIGGVVQVNANANSLRSGSVLDVLVPKRKTEADSKNVVYTTTTTTNNNSFGAQFKKSASEWECDACMLRNKQDADKCIACETPHVSKNVTNAPIKPTTTMLPPVANVTNTNTLIMSNSFGIKFKKSATEWECDACMLRNKEEANKCIACETPRKGEGSSNAPLTSNVPIIANSFGNTFKPKSDTWECSVCLIVNKSNDLKCIACESTKPGATATNANADITSSLTKEAPKFKFGFAAATTTTNPTTTATSSPKSDNVFKMLAAAQNTTKWSCSACFAQNDAGRMKCACCEEPKPGTIATANKSGPTFAFGQSAVAATATATNTENKFDFVKGDNNALNKTTTTATANAAVSSTTTAATFGFNFGSSKPLTTTTTSSADSTDAPNKILETTGFKFASSSNSSQNTNTINKTEEKSPKTVTFNLPATNKSTGVTSTVIDVKSNDTNKSAFSGFAFGMTTAASTASNINLPTATTSTASNDMSKPTIPMLGGFAFSTTTSTATTTSSTAAAVTTTATVSTSKVLLTNTISFGSGGGGGVTSAPVNSFSFGSPATTKLGATATSNVVNSPSLLTSTPTFGSFSTTTTTNTSTAPSTIGATKLFGTITPSFSNNIATPTKTSTGTAEAAGTSTTTASTLNNSFNFGGQQSILGVVSTTASSTASTSAAAAASSASASSSTMSIMSTTSIPATSMDNTFIFGQPAPPAASNPVTSIFSGNNATNSAAAAPSNSFVFGNANTNTIVDAAAATKPAEKSNLQTSTPHTFGAAFGAKPESSSSFGATGAAAKTAVTSSAVSGTVFGSFGGNTTTPTFGSVAPPTTTIFGSGTTPASTVSSSSEATGVFGSFGSRAAAAPTNNIFSSNNAAQPTSTFGGFAAAAAAAAGAGSAGTSGAGASADQSTGSAPAALGTFGSFAAASANNAATPAPMPTFGGFGAAAAPTAAIKPAFNFGGAATIQNPSSSVGSFSFGANAAVPANNATTKPAFNFTATNSAANFNFTNSAAVNSSTTSDQQANGPFQFGAATTPAAAPMSMNVFSFGPGPGTRPHAEATTNTSAPFQFNAGAAAPANIFAINPATTSGNNAQNVQQARRKIRAPTRRLTPR